MKSFQEFLAEAEGHLDPLNLLSKKAGNSPIGRFTRNLVDPRTGPISNITTTLIKAGAQRLPEPFRGPVERVAPLVGTAAGLMKRAPQISAAIETLKSRPTASGKVKVGTYGNRPYYVEK